METPEKSTTEEGTDLGGAPGGSIWSRLVFDRFSALYVLVAFFIFFGITEDSFLMWNGSLEFVLTDKIVVLMLALAFLVPLTTEAFDLSIGAIAALALLIVNKIVITFLYKHQHTQPLVVTLHLLYLQALDRVDKH